MLFILGMVERKLTGLCVLSLAIFFCVLFVLQVSVIADDILKNVEFDALRVVFNKFQSVVSFLPTVSTVLSPEVSSN